MASLDPELLESLGIDGNASITDVLGGGGGLPDGNNFSLDGVDTSLLTFSRPEWLRTYHNIVMYIISVISIFINTTTVCCFIKFPRLRQQRYALSCSLAVSDMLVSLSNIATNLWEYSGRLDGPCLNEYEATMYYGLITVFYLVSIVHSLVIGVDRFLAVNFPFWYLSWVTKRTMAAVLSAIWAVIVLYFGGILLLWTRGRRTVLGCFLLSIGDVSIYVLVLYVMCVVTLCSLYGRIWCLARSQAKRISDQQVTTAKAQEKASNRKANGLVTALLVSYTVLYLPTTINWLFQQVHPSPKLLAYLVPFADQCVISTTLLNVFIYARFMNDFKQAYRALFCCRQLHVSSGHA